MLTPAGLLPVAVAGVDIEQLLAGAKKAVTLLKEETLEQNEAYRYAVIRQVLFKKGYQIVPLLNRVLENFMNGGSNYLVKVKGKKIGIVSSCS